jgi:hypothetical protein
MVEDLPGARTAKTKQLYTLEDMTHTYSLRYGVTPGPRVRMIELTPVTLSLVCLYSMPDSIDGKSLPPQSPEIMLTWRGSETLPWRGRSHESNRENAMASIRNLIEAARTVTCEQPSCASCC